MTDCKTEGCDGILGHYPNGKAVICTRCKEHKGTILQRDMNDFENTFALLFCSSKCLKEVN